MRANNGGRPKGSADWIKLIREECTEDRWREIVLRALDEAAGRVENADTRAARDWLSKYVAPQRVLDRVVKKDIECDMDPLEFFLRGL